MSTPERPAPELPALLHDLPEGVNLLQLVMDLASPLQGTPNTNQPLPAQHRLADPRIAFVLGEWIRTEIQVRVSNMMDPALMLVSARFQLCYKFTYVAVGYCSIRR